MTTINTGDLVSASQINQWAPAGAVVMYAGSSAPSGWFICDGSAIDRTTYAALFAVIGTLYGVGNGTTTFNLPDCRGRTGVGYAPSGGHTDVSTLGNNDGVALANRRPKHRHTVGDGGHTHTTALPSHYAGAVSITGFYPGTSNNLLTENATPTIQATTPASSSATTGVTVGTATDALDAPAYLVLNYIIRAKDL